MPSRESARIVIVGGGVIGLGVAWHLAGLGRDDVLLIERNRLTSGTSWHAAGIVGPLRASMNATRLAMVANEVFPALERETGQGTGYRRTGGFWLARTEDRLVELRRIAAVGEMAGLDARMVGRDEVAAAAPNLRVDDLAGALWVAEDGQANPVDVCMAYAKGARAAGIRIREGVACTGIERRNGAVHGVRLSDGTAIRCETVVNCAGAWARAVGAMAGVPVPLQAVEHMYVTTEPLRGTNPSKVIAWPMYHQGISPAAATGIGADPTRENVYTPTYLGEALRWYDRWLKGVRNGIDHEPPVHIFVQNEGWRSEETWPLEREVRLRFHLVGDGLLDREPGDPGTDEYTADFTHDASFGPPLDASQISVANAMKGRAPFNAPSFGHSRQQMFGVPGDLPYRTDRAGQVLTYTSVPLEADMEVTGHPVVSVSVSSTADHGDLYFYLEDVDPEGNAVLVTEYQHRAGFDRLVDNDLLIPGNTGIDVKPELPWHGFREADYTDRVFADGAVVRITTSLYPTSWLFREGHRIRLSIAAADWPVFDLHPRLSPGNRPDAEDNIVPTITVHRGGGEGSYVELPVIPR